MSVASAIPMERPWLPERDSEEVDEVDPAGEAEQGTAHKKRDQVRLNSPARLSGRIHDVTVLSVLAVIQVSWLAALVYGLWLLA
jgi:hypothetical protein